MKGNPCIFTVFGGTGDLTKRKLMPALFKLFIDGKLSSDFAVVGVGRKDYEDSSYRAMIRSYVEKFGKCSVEEKSWELFCKKLHYSRFDFISEEIGYESLKKKLSAIDCSENTMGNRIYYLAVSPDMFEPIVQNLKSNSMIENDNSWQRIMVEKPFGSSLQSARKLNESLSQLLSERHFFRIDHYLGKEMVQNITAIRFSNSIFEPLWNYNYIESIQILSYEEIGVENRGSYYESSGILRDMVQNHILQMLSLICMEPPSKLDPDSIRDEKVKVLKSLRLFDRESADKDVVLGQYGPSESSSILGYREESGVSSTSKVPTFIALRAHIDNYRWGGVPIYIKAGKRLGEKLSQIVIKFKKLPGTLYYDEYKNSDSNYLVVKIQPSEGILFQVNIKSPGSDNVLEKVDMNYCQTCRYSINSLEAYERLILEAINDNPALFTRWDELEFSWRYIDSIEKSISNMKLNFPNYEAGSDGPRGALHLLKKYGSEKWGV